jgi:hypothetical protein
MSTVLSPPEARVILHNISWSLYEQLLAAHADKSSPRFVYDRGELDWVFRSVLSASINAAFRLRPYESPYNSSC